MQEKEYKQLQELIQAVVSRCQTYEEIEALECIFAGMFSTISGIHKLTLVQEALNSD